MATLVDQIDRGSGWEDSSVQVDYTIGTLVDSVVGNESGEVIPDEYTLILSAFSAGSGTITVGTSSVNNPFRGDVHTMVAMDGVTVRDDIIPGLDITFNDTVANGDTATLLVGVYHGVFTSAGISVGIPSTGVRHRVRNIKDTNSINEAMARVLTQSIQVKKIGSVFSMIGNFADGATEKVAGGGSYQVTPYVLTISGVSGSAETKIATLSVDGVALGLASIRDRHTGEFVSGTGLKAIESYTYMVITGPLSGLVFNIDPDCANGDETNVLIFPPRYVQIAPDVSGEAGVYGTDDVYLTEEGEDTGVISATGEAYYWVRVLVPGSSNNESNPYPAFVALVGIDSGSAEW